MLYLPSYVRPRHTRRFSMLLLVLIATLLAGCGVSTAGGRNAAKTAASPTAKSLPTPAPTMTPAAAHPLQWQTHTLPAPLGGSSLAFSPLNRNIVWMCDPTSDGTMVWLSRDQAVTWQQVTTIHADGQPTDWPVDGPFTICWMKADDLDPATAAVQMGWGWSVGIYQMDYTHDSGKTWTLSQSPVTPTDIRLHLNRKYTLAQLSTIHGVTYALFTHSNGFAGLETHFMTSKDGMQSWQPLDTDLVLPNSDQSNYSQVYGFWIDPVTGNILAHTRADAITTDRFYTSSDNGTTWQEIQTPTSTDFLVRQPYAATATWEICGLREQSGTGWPGWPKPPICTLDSGKTWTSRSANTPEDVKTFAIANDGDILAGDENGIYRASPTRGAWESLGPPPAAGALGYS